jgi:hypothetical protein
MNNTNDKLGCDLGKLILSLNPYTNRKIPETEPVQLIGEMDPYCSYPKSGEAGDISQVEVETDGPYRQEWTFKGEPQKVGMAYRIKYRMPVYKKDAEGKIGKPVRWFEDYLLIGFEGSMGG